MEYKAKYGAAKMLGTLAAAIGWIIIILGVIGAFIGYNTATGERNEIDRMFMYGIAAFSFLFAMIGLLIACVGELILAMADNANHSGAILAIMKANKSTQG